MIAFENSLYDGYITEKFLKQKWLHQFILEVKL